jgi:tRNA(fMet)-specific endonuclease VapC
LRDFISAFEIINWTESDAETAGKIRTDLEKNGHTIGPLDIQIAGQAVSNELILVTNNEKEFSRVNGLKVENWV